MRIVAKVVDEVAPTDIQHGTGRDNRAEAHLFQLAPVEDGRQQRSALAKEGHITRPRRILGEGSVQTDGWIHDPQAVGANQAHAAAPELILNLPLQIDALRTSLLESRG